MIHKLCCNFFSTLLIVVLLLSQQLVLAQQANLIDSVSNRIMQSEDRKSELSKEYKKYRKTDIHAGVAIMEKVANEARMDKDYWLANKAYRNICLYCEASSLSDSILKYIHLAMESAQESNDRRLQLNAIKLYVTYNNKLHLDINEDSITQQALKILDNDNALDTLSESEKSLYRAKIHKWIGEYLVLQDRTIEAIPYFDISLKELSALDTSANEVKKSLVQLYFSIGYQFYKTNYIGRAKIILLEAASYESSNGGYDSKGEVYTVLGALYKKEGKLDSALYYFERSRDVYIEYDYTTGEAGALENIGIVYKDMGQLDRAMKSFEASLEIRKKLKRKDILIGLYVNMSNVFIQRGQYREAEKHILDALEMSKGVMGKEVSKAVAYQNLAEAYAKWGKYEKAFTYYKKYKSLNDSLTSLQIQKEQVAFDKKMELAETRAESQLTKERNKVLEVENDQARTTNVALLTGLGLLLIILYAVYRLGRQKRENQRLKFEKDQEEQQNKILNLLSESEINSMNSFMQGQEKERSRIASDLHDRLGSLLSTVRLHFDLLKVNIEELSSEHAEKMNTSVELLDTAVEEVRLVSKDLTKGVITQFGLLAAVVNLQEAINASGKINIEVVETGFDKRLESDIEINLFRVIQEMVTNTIKHAEASEMIIQFVQSKESINIIVEDNGKGFDPYGVKQSGIGLVNIRKRISDIGATLDLNSSADYGTTYVIELKF